MITKNHNSLCEEAKLYYYDSLCEESCGPIPQSISNHIEQCRNCQNQINQLKVALSQNDCDNSQQRQDRSAVTTMLQLHFAYIGEHVTCETVRPFLPGLLDPALEIRIPTPITVHLNNCPQCAEDLKAIKKLNLNGTQLYRLSQFFTEGPSRNTTEFPEMGSIIPAMAERADSEVVTVYNTDESAKDREAGKLDDLYAGFPISVEVIIQKVDIEQPVSTIDFATNVKEKASATNLKPFIKIGLAAAAVILIGFALLLNTPSAKAVTIQQMYKALENVKNVYISRFTAAGNKPTQEKWISQTLNIYMTKTATAKASVLWDINNMQRKILPFDTGEILTDQLADDNIAGIKRKMSGSLGLMPLYNISDLPRDSEWLPVDDHLEAADGIEIYDLKWIVKTSGSSESKRWRYFVDSKTFLPKKIEIFETSIGQSEYSLVSRILIETKSDSEIRTVIKDAGF
jgi:hypothetical protein